MLLVIIWMEVLPGAVKLTFKEKLDDVRSCEIRERKISSLVRSEWHIVVRQLSL